MKNQILIIDDEPDAIRFIEAILSDVGDFDCVAASDGDEGLKAARKNPPQLIILDVMMPRKDGFKVFYELKESENTRDIPIIMLTGVADKAGIRFVKKDMQDYMGKEPVDYIEKPLDPDRLKRTVRNIFNI